jgi:hypothetical protein
MEELTGEIDRGRRGLFGALRDPVVLILLLAGFFDGVSGNAIHSILLFSAAFALTWESMGNRAPVPSPGPVSHLSSLAGIPVIRAGLAASALAFAVIVGRFGRYSWPATVPVALVAALAIAIGWRGRGHTLEPAPLGPVGAVAWAALFVTASLWELIQLLLQPSFTTDSYAHPTLSVLTDPVLASHLGRSVVLFAWLAFGWFLLER